MGANKAGQHLTPLQQELREAMEGWGCPLCRLSHKAERIYIESLSYERILDLKTRGTLRASRGLCAVHSHVWEEVKGGSLGLAIVYRDVVRDLLQDTEPDPPVRRLFPGRRRKLGGTRQQLQASGPCPACEIGHQTVLRFGRLLLEDLHREELQSRLRACGGLCLSHLRAVLALPAFSRAKRVLLDLQRDVWRQTLEELGEFIRKSDYRFSDEQLTSAEGSAWHRVLDLLCGLRGYKDSP